MKLKGYINKSCNKEMFNKKIEDIKSIYIKLLDYEDIQKVKNVVNTYKTEKLSIPIYTSPEGGILIKVTTRKLTKYLQSKLPLESWDNKMFDVEIDVKKYSFKNTNPDKGEIGFIVSGLKFNLQSLVEK